MKAEESLREWSRKLAEWTDKLSAIIRRPTEHLQENFRRHGGEFGVTRLEDYETLARQFFREAMRSPSQDYAIIGLSQGRVAIDYRGERRGVFLKDGTPLAFFKPDFREQGYLSKEQELTDWRSGKVAEYLA